MENQKVNAGQLMEFFFETGAYKAMKAAEKRSDDFKKSIRSILDKGEDKRVEFKNQGVVAKYIRKPIYGDVDYVSLNKLLLDLGILEYLHSKNHLLSEHMTIDAKKAKGNPVLDLFVLPKEKSIGISTNKNGRYQFEDTVIEGLDIDAQMERYVYFKNILDEQLASYEEIKKKILQCPILQKEGKIQHKYGSVYLKDNPRKKYDVLGIVEHFGMEMLIQFGKPSSDLLDDLIKKGMIKKEEIEQFKPVIDYRLDFVIMSLESEENMLSYLHDKRMAAPKIFKR